MLNKDLRKILKRFCELQDELNTIINPHWKKEISDKQFAIAVISELNELLECYNWEWWKKKEVDLNNAKIEIVDIFHFLLSINLLKSYYISEILLTDTIDEFLLGIEKYNKVVDNSTVIDKIMYLNFLTSQYYHNSLSEFMDRYIDYEKFRENELKYAKLFLQLPLEYLRNINTNFFVLALNVFNGSVEDFCRMYVLKYLLNKIRQKYGYKVGSYNKMINNQEDNEVLHTVVKELNNLSIEEIVEKENLDRIIKLVEEKLSIRS